MGNFFHPTHFPLMYSAFLQSFRRAGKYVLSFPLLLLTFSFTLASHNEPPALISGQIFDRETNQPLSGARIEIVDAGQITYTDELGRFRLDDFAGKTVELNVSSIGYETQKLSLEPDSTIAFLKLALNPTMIQLSEVLISDERHGLKPLNSISEVDLALRPVQSSQELLQNVPGLFIAQHAGGGKAEQIFLRGFDIDHGTDIALSVDGMPVNMVSHAHGQGYSDLHFVIPETIERIDFEKGMYEAGIGNFNTAGYAAFQTRHTLDQSLVKLEAGQFNTFRGLAMIDLLPNQDNHHLYVASEFRFSDGYFEASQNFNRLNTLAKYSGFIGDNLLLSVSASTFSSSWDASGQIPERAVSRGQIDRFGAIDSTEGGETSRRNLNIELNQYLDNGAVIRNQLFASQYEFSLYSNFTFFLEDEINGDQIHQTESRNLYGYRGSYTQSYSFGNIEMNTVAGLSLRVDEVDDVELSHTLNRQDVLETFALGDVQEMNAALFISQSFRLGKWSANAGLRYDQFRFAYEDQLTAAYDPQSEAKGIVSPKFSLGYEVNDRLRLYAKAGTGFHSNDSRVILSDRSRDILPRAYGADLGFIAKPLPGMLVQAAIWTLGLDQEFVYVGDAGIVEPSGKTQRMGVDLSTRYQVLPWLFADVDVTYTLASAIEEPDGENYIPLAPSFTLTGGLQARWDQLSASLRFRHLADRPANEDYSLTAEGYSLLDGTIQYRVGAFEWSLTGDNLLNTAWKEAQFETESRLAGEDQSVTEIHFTPGTPRALRMGMAVWF